MTVISRSPPFAIRRVAGSSLPSYLPIASRTIKNVSANNMSNVAPPATGTNQFTGHSYDLGSLASGFSVQGSPIFNKYYGQFGAMVGLNLTGHRSAYVGNECYIFPFTNSISTNLWKRVTNPYPDELRDNGSLPVNPYSVASATYTGPSFGEYIPDYFGKGTSGDHTRSHQVACAGGTNGQGLVFYPKTASDDGADNGNSYGLRPHTFDCGVETGTPTYDSTKVWWRRGNSNATLHCFGGGCWYEPDINCVGYLLPDANAGNQMSAMALFDLTTNDWRTPNLTFPSTVFLGADTAVEYIAQRKFVLTCEKTVAGGPYLIDRNATSSPIPLNRLTGWTAPPSSVSGWQLSLYNTIKFCPADGNFYLLVTYNNGGNSDALGALAAPQIWKFTPPVNMLTATYAQIVASTGGNWTNITSTMVGDALVRGNNSGPAKWGPYNGFFWSDAFNCFIWCGGAIYPVQLINPM